MFSLIITVVSIALVAILAFAALYYGGNAWTNSQQKADAARTINAGQQIAGAVQMYRNDTGSVPATLSELVSNNQYLTSLPEGTWTTGTDSVVAAVSEAQCMEINTQLGLNLTSIPSCSDGQFSSTSVCCQTP